jgi:Flp pilus assembly protein TadG
MLQKRRLKPTQPSLRRGRRLFLDRRGGLAIEMALVIPVFLALVIGVVEFGRVLAIRSSLQYAVEEAARYAMVRQTLDASKLTTLVKDRVAAADTENVAVAVSDEVSGGVKYWKISASYSVTMVTSMFGIGPITLTGASRIPALE